MTDQPLCEICGEPMPAGEETFKFHGYSGNCPKPPLVKPEREALRERCDARTYWEAGREAAIARIQRDLDGYYKEHGTYDPETGVTEFSDAGQDYVSTLEELVESIRELKYPSESAEKQSKPKYDKTFCSNCGHEFGPGDSKFRAALGKEG